MSKLHICYITDQNYISLCQTSMLSILEHKNIDTQIEFYIMGDRLEDTTNFDKFNIDKVHVNIIPLNAKEILKRTDLKLFEYVTVCTYARYLIPTLSIFKDIDKLLYLDCDTIILKDLTELYNFNLENKLIGICKNPVRILQGYRVMQTFDHVDHCHSHNAGILLLDLNKLREINFTQKCIKRTEQTGCDDEYIINELFFDNLQDLPPTANIPMTLFLEAFPHYIKDIDIWNLYYGTHFVSLNDLFYQGYILHFVGNTTNASANPNFKKIYNEANERLKEFLNSGKINNNLDWSYYSSLIR